MSNSLPHWQCHVYASQQRLQQQAQTMCAPNSQQNNTVGPRYPGVFVNGDITSKIEETWTNSSSSCCDSTLPSNSQLSGRGVKRTISSLYPSSDLTSLSSLSRSGSGDIGVNAIKLPELKRHRSCINQADTFPSIDYVLSRRDHHVNAQGIGWTDVSVSRSQQSKITEDSEIVAQLLAMQNAPPSD